MLYLLQNQSYSRNDLSVTVAVTVAILNFSLNVYPQFFKHYMVPNKKMKRNSLNTNLSTGLPLAIMNKNLAIANRSRVSCINTNNDTMTLKYGLEVTQGH